MRPRKQKRPSATDALGFPGLFANNSDSQGILFTGFLTNEEKREASDIASRASIGEMTAYKFEEFPIGKFALYEVIIQTKSISMDLSPVAERLYRLLLENCILTAFATRRALDQLKPDAGISYHTAYSYNRTFQHLAEQRPSGVVSQCEFQRGRARYASCGGSL